MTWLASFKGLKKVGVPPLLALVVVAALFFVVRRNSNEPDGTVA